LPGGAGVPTEKDPARSVASDLSAGKRNALRASFYFAGLPSAPAKRPEHRKARYAPFLREGKRDKKVPRFHTRERRPDVSGRCENQRRRCCASRSKPSGRTKRESPALRLNLESESANREIGGPRKGNSRSLVGHRTASLGMTT